MINFTTLTNAIVEVSVLTLLGLLVATIVTPVYTTIAYKYKFWKKLRTQTTTGERAVVLEKMHAKKHARNFPTMAGVIFLFAVAIITLLLNNSREQTWLPLAATLGAGGIGLIDDIVNIRGGGKGVAGLRMSMKLGLITLVAGIGAWFFMSKLGYDSIHITFFDQVYLGWWLAPIFVFVVVATANAVNISDGLDGLAGGLLSSSFAAFGTIALLQGNVGIAGFCFTIVGALLSYVWFNIYPARFMMGDVGSFALGTALGVVAMLTDTLMLLPVIGAVFVVEVASSALQIASKRLWGRKIFISAPIHHHFEAIGWPETKVTMRFWLIGQTVATIGVVLAIIGGHV